LLHQLFDYSNETRPFITTTTTKNEKEEEEERFALIKRTILKHWRKEKVGE
jgi:hypothetical protein